ncbi:cobalt-precorrin-5B (C(1))-methyltransferase, partial [Pyxidicoccus fallax]
MSQGASPLVPPRDKRGTRTGFTTGACAAAAAKAAARVLVRGGALTEVETTLPNRDRVTFALHRCETDGERAVCSVIKDAGDDPDCTHGAELVAEVRLTGDGEVTLAGGQG